jgi:pimeloyl-ACP methyl ester carboxylesterase
MTTTTTKTVDAGGGRVLAVTEAGDPNGLAVFVHHGTPSSGLLYAPWAEHAAANGIRLIGFDRAGYGGSSRAHGRAIGAVAGDVETIADALGVDRFATWGISGGGPHALACAALCGDRLTAAASLAGVAPWGADGLDWLAGMGEANVEEFELVLAGEEALRPGIARDRTMMLEAGPTELREVLDTLLGDADRAVLTDAFAHWMAGTNQAGLRDNGDGWIDDNLAFVAPWGFEPSAITRPVLIVQGGDDRFVPRSHGDWLAARIPGAEAWIDDAAGHLTLLENDVPAVHEWLRARS